MAEVDRKDKDARVGRSSLYRALRESAGANLMERNYQQVLGDLKVKEQLDGMAKEVEELPAEEKLAEVLSRLLVVLTLQTRPEQTPLIFWQMYLHLRATGLLDPVKANIGSLVGLDGKRIPPKEGM